MKRIWWNILLMMIAVSTMSCQRDILFYGTSDRAWVQFDIDWTATGLTPNGVSLYIFDHASGQRVDHVVISSNPRTVKVYMPVGTFDIVVHNNIEGELKNISMVGTDNLHTFEAAITSTEVSRYRSFAARQSRADERFTTETEPIAGALIENVTVRPNQVEYYKERPKQLVDSVTQTVAVRPEIVTETITIEVDVKNLASLAGAPRTHLTNIAGGYRWKTGEKSDNVVTPEFVLNNRVLDTANPKNGHISKTMTLFGPKLQNGSYAKQMQLVFEFVLADGQSFFLEKDINDAIRSTQTPKGWLHEIRTTVELPEVTGGGNNGGGGGDGGGGLFQTSVEGWVNENIGITV